jgi:hypothetical protein
VARHPVGGALLAGAVATQFATVFGIWFPGFGLPSLNWPVVNGELILGTVGATPTAATYFVGELSHFADGVFFALLFALLFHPFIPVRNTILGNLVKAFLYGTVLAVISAAWSTCSPTHGSKWRYESRPGPFEITGMGHRGGAATAAISAGRP